MLISIILSNYTVALRSLEILLCTACSSRTVGARELIFEQLSPFGPYIPVLPYKKPNPTDMARILSVSDTVKLDFTYGAACIQYFR